MTAAGAPTVVVAVLTYRRPQLLRGLLPRLAEQLAELDSDCAASILVVDNDPDGSARAEVARHQAVRYQHEVRPGIAAARNRAVDAASDADLLVFIDDDETPQPGWLPALIATWRRTAAAGVAGKVVPDYAAPPPDWITAGRFFVRATRATGTRVPAAGAGNLLLDLNQVRAAGLRFDESFGLAGGEDTLFTRMMTRSGLALVWCEEAKAADLVPAQRMSRRWVLTRAFSHGNAHARVELRLKPGLRTRIELAALGMSRAAGGVARAAFGMLTRSMVHRARGMRAGSRGAGIIAGAAGAQFHEYTRSAAGRFRRRASRSASDQVVVLQSFPGRAPVGNPYRVLLVEGLTGAGGVTVVHFDWRTALLGRYDVFHVHWPETLLGARTPVRKLVRQLQFALLLLRLRLARIPVVRTVHNLELPQGISRREALLLRLAQRAETVRVRLNSSTDVAGEAPVYTVLHGHYRDWFADHPQRPAIPGRLVFFGLVRRYKGVEALVRAFRQTAGPADSAATAATPAAMAAGIGAEQLSLQVVGNPSTAELADGIRAAAGGDRRIQLDLDFVTDADLVAAVTAAELVVLPYREMHNSAGVLTALSLDRPVLVPDNLVNRRLADEVGPGWVHRYQGALTGAALTAALAELRDDPPTAPPNLDQRDWVVGGEQHRLAYLDALARAGRGRS